MKRVASHKRGATCIAGKFSFIAKDAHHGDMALSYNLLFEFDSRESAQYPTVYETKGVIPRIDDNHIQANASLCLGTPLQLHEYMQEKPSLCDFAEEIIIPYLYAVTLKLLHYNKGEMVYGELSHENLGLYEDLKGEFSVTSYSELQGILKTLSANASTFEHSICPYCKTQTIGECPHHWHLASCRRIIKENPHYADFMRLFSKDKEGLFCRLPDIFINHKKSKDIRKTYPIGIMIFAELGLIYNSHGAHLERMKFVPPIECSSDTFP